MTLVDQLACHADTGGQHSLLDGDGRGTPPTEAELDIPYASPSEPPLLECGVVYSADWKKFADGMARHARAQALALAAAGIGVRLQSISSEGMFLDSDVRSEVRDEVAHLTNVTMKSVMIAVRQAVFHSADFVRNLVVPAGGRLVDFELEQRIYQNTIIYTSLERDRVSPVLIDIFKRCAELWVPCHQNAQALVSSGMPEDKVHVIPYPYDPAGPVCKIPAPRGHERVPEGKRFYSIGKWEPRKNHAGLLMAFLRAFTPKDKASLVLKVHGWGAWEGYPDIQQALTLCGEDPVVRANGWTDINLRKRVKIITDKISDAEIVALHAQNNIYVSASHGEAWDLPAFDAKCAGNRLVHVGFGGSADYADDADVWLGYRLKPVNKVYGWEECNWAEYDMEEMVASLRIAQPPTKRVHPKGFNARFSAHAVGEKMKDRILRVAARSHVELPAMLERAGSFG